MTVKQNASGKWITTDVPKKTFPSRAAARKAQQEAQAAKGGGIISSMPSTQVRHSALGAGVEVRTSPLEDPDQHPTSKYNLQVGPDGQTGSLTTIHDGELVTFTHEHPHWPQIVAAVVSDQDPSKWFDPDAATAVEFNDERVEVVETPTHEKVITFQGEPVHPELRNVIARWARESRDMSGLVRFMERLAENPDENSRASLFRWLEAKQLRVMEDGRFLGFKSVQSDWKSSSSGKALVDDVSHHGRIPNRVGAVVSMDREWCNSDTRFDCGDGLHVGTYQYANTFGGSGRIVLEVAVAPEDVVSVPASETFKIRCCRYEVLGVHGDVSTLAVVTVNDSHVEEVSTYTPPPPAKAGDLSHHESPRAVADTLVIEEKLEGKIPKTFLGRFVKMMKGDR